MQTRLSEQSGFEFPIRQPLKEKGDLPKAQNAPETISTDEATRVNSMTSSEVVQRFPVQVEARGNAHKFRGGTSIKAKVGAESEWVYGSKPPGGVPNLIKNVGASIQGKTRYIAGHLLNDNMGGRGDNDNLTVLSSDANKRHRGVESKVKNLAQKADLINKGNNKFGDPKYDHGARYTVEVLSPNPDPNPPYSLQEKYIGRGLKISIDPIRIDKATRAKSDWPEEVGKVNDLTDHEVQNVPPYPVVPKKKKLTPVQKHIVRALVYFHPARAREKDVWNYIETNVKNPPTKKGVKLALKKGVTAKFFNKRAVGYKLIAKNL